MSRIRKLFDRHRGPKSANSGDAPGIPDFTLSSASSEDSRVPAGSIKPAPSSEQAWGQFEADLATALSNLAEDEYLVVSRKRSAYFVQFAAQGCYGMRAEAVSNTYIPEPYHLSRGGFENLIKLGWNPPTYAPSEVATEPADGSSNFFIDAAVPVPYAELARISVKTLREVFQVRHPGELEYSGYAADGSSIRLPLLRIRRKDH